MAICYIKSTAVGGTWALTFWSKHLKKLALPLCACPFYRHCMKLLFYKSKQPSTPGHVQWAIQGQTQDWKMRRLCSLLSSPFGSWLGWLGLDTRLHLLIIKTRIRIRRV